MTRLLALFRRGGVCPLVAHTRRMRALGDVVAHVKENHR